MQDLDDGVGLFTKENHSTTMKDKFDRELAAEFIVMTGQHRVQETVQQLLAMLPYDSAVDVTGVDEDLRGGSIVA